MGEDGGAEIGERVGLGEGEGVVGVEEGDGFGVPVRIARTVRSEVRIIGVEVGLHSPTCHQQR